MFRGMLDHQDIFVRYFPSYPSWHAQYQRSWRDDFALGHDRTGTNDGMSTDPSAIENHGANTDQNIVFYFGTVDNRTMSNRHSVSQPAWKARVSMKAG
jgi:hypothetical protein